MLVKRDGEGGSYMNDAAITFAGHQYYKFGKQASARGAIGKHALYVVSQYNSHPPGE
jgi:hypothetical protein